MENKTKAGVDVYRIRGYEFVLPSTYAETPIIITMEYLNAKMDRIRIYKFGSRSLLKTEELILAIKENKIIKYGRRKYKR